MIFPINGGILNYLVLPVISYSWILFMFYTVALVVLPNLWEKGKYFLLAAVLLLFYILHILYNYASHYYFMTWFDSRTFDGTMPIESFVRMFSWWFMYYVFVAIVFFSYKRTIEELKKKNELEKELIKTQNLFFRAQFNPHFLFNVLNYIYDKAIPVSDNLSQAILLLSEIMRYSLKENSPDHKASLNDEIKYISNFVELNKLRFNSCIFVELQVIGKTENKRIPPLLFISFVENAFKHGDLNDKNYPLSITIEAQKDFIRFAVRNKKKMNGEVISHGIGNQNVVQRLELAYKENYNLDVKNDAKFYSCDLVVYN